MLYLVLYLMFYPTFLYLGSKFKYRKTSVDPPQDCGGVWLDMSIVGSVMHVSSSRLSSNLYGTCGLLDLSCMFRHQVRTRSALKSVESGLGRRDRPVKAPESRSGRTDRPGRSPEGCPGRKDRPVRSPERCPVRSPERCPGRKDRPVMSPEGCPGQKDRTVRMPEGRLGRKDRPERSPEGRKPRRKFRRPEAGSEIYS